MNTTCSSSLFVRDCECTISSLWLGWSPGIPSLLLWEASPTFFIKNSFCSAYCTMTSLSLHTLPPPFTPSPSLTPTLLLAPFITPVLCRNLRTTVWRHQAIADLVVDYGRIGISDGQSDCPLGSVLFWDDCLWWCLEGALETGMLRIKRGEESSQAVTTRVQREREK